MQESRPNGIRRRPSLLGLLLFSVALAPASLLGQSAGRAPDHPSSGLTVTQVADAYLEVYQALDVDRLVDFYDGRTVLSDPTGVAIGADLLLEGRDQIEPFLRTAFASVSDLTFDIDTRFTTGPYVVLSGSMEYGVDGATAGLEAATARIRASFVMVLEIEGDIVVSHTDYVDYDGVETWPGGADPWNWF